MKIFRYKQFENKEYGKDFSPEEIKRTFGIPKEMFEEDLEVLFSDAFGPDVKPSVTYDIFSSNLFRNGISVEVSLTDEMMGKYLKKNKNKTTAFGSNPWQEFPIYNFKNESDKVYLENDLWDLLVRYGLDSGNFVCDIEMPDDFGIINNTININITKLNTAFESIVWPANTDKDSTIDMVIEDALVEIEDEWGHIIESYISGGLLPHNGDVNDMRFKRYIDFYFRSEYINITEWDEHDIDYGKYEQLKSESIELHNDLENAFNKYKDKFEITYDEYYSNASYFSNSRSLLTLKIKEKK